MAKEKPGAEKHNQDIKSAVARAVLLLMSDFSPQFVTIEWKNGKSGFIVGFKDCGQSNVGLAKSTADEKDVTAQVVAHSIVAELSGSCVSIGHLLAEDQLGLIAEYLPQE